MEDISLMRLDPDKGWRAESVAGHYAYYHDSGASLFKRVAKDDLGSYCYQWWLYQEGYTPCNIHSAGEANSVIRERNLA